jgi:hypothetical protein
VDSAPLGDRLDVAGRAAENSFISLATTMQAIVEYRRLAIATGATVSPRF